MEELVGHLSEKAGISKEISTKVVQVLLQYFRDHLPKPIVDAIEAYLGGKGSAMGDVMKGLGGLGGLFGGDAKK